MPYLPWLKPTSSKHSEIATTPEDDLREEIDTDGDLLVDEDELYITGTDPDEPDSDNDALTDGEEFKYWTDRYNDELNSEPPDWLRTKHPHLTETELRALFHSTGDLDGDGKPNIMDKDSDNDGLPDGFEKFNDLDPADPNSNISDLSPEMKRYILVNSYNNDKLTSFSYDMNFNDDNDIYPSDKEFNEILFKITPAANPRYWRTAVYDDYVNGQWNRRNTYPADIYRGSELTPEVEEFEAKHEFSYSVTFQGSVTGMLPTALHTTRVYSVTPDSYIRYNPIGTFETNQYIRSYAFNATIYDYDDDVLRRANAPMEIENHYLTELNTVDDTIIGRGKKVAAGYSSDFEKASAIAKYLKSNFIYDLNSYEYNYEYPNENIKFKHIHPYNTVLVNMLTKTYRGHCVDFATVFVLMCRANGIPAQMAVGFGPGDIEDPAASERVVRVGHSHAWGEVLLEGVGWLAFEPTPNRAIYGNTTGVTVAGSDNNVITYNVDPDGNATDLIDNGTGGGGMGGEYVDITELVNHKRMDSDLDGIKNYDDPDDDNDGVLDQDELSLGTNPFSKDTDKDGLTDLEEIQNGTSPLNSDTDSDGLTDYYELEFSKTDPLDYDTDSGGAYDGLEIEMGGDPLDPGDDPNLIDTDHDGLTDAKEAELGTDPNKWDTDGGGASDNLEYIAGLDPVNDPDDDLKVLDSDNDGLMDSKELELGTDRFAYDSDLGGMGDGVEVLYDHNPLNNSDDFWLLDYDGDGLTNEQEYKLGTDMNDSDTDSGGVSDGAEVSYGSDPLDDDDDQYIDSDGDGLTDILERDHNTNPYKIDTDNDGLPDGWVDYNKNGEKDLGEFEDRNLDGDAERWRPWNNGTGPGETNPNDLDTDNDWLTDGLEVSIGTNPLKEDTDGDGLSDWEEVQWLTDPFDTDTDDDGLFDGAEVYETNSNPILIDSDGDGLDDRLESEYGTDPLRLDTDGDGWLDGEEIDMGTSPNLDTDFPTGPGSDVGNGDGTGGGNLITPDPPVVRPKPGDPGHDPNLPDRDTDLDPSTSNPTGDGPSTDGAGGSGMGNLGNIWPIIIGLILILIIGMYYLSWRTQHIDELAEVAERAEERLSKIEDKREFDAIRLEIFEAYKSMLKIMQRYDFIREPSETPREFKKDIMSALPITETNIGALTGIFEEARYSDHVLDLTTRDEAIKSFRELKFELRSLKRGIHFSRAAS